MDSDLTGAWHNQHGSILDVVIQPGGKLTGTYRTGVGIAVPGEAFPITGFVANDLVAFAVNFGSRDSLTSWTGHYTRRNGAERLELLWHMAVHVPHPERSNELWKGLWSGSDTFVRGEPATEATGVERMPPHPTGSRRA